LITQEALSETAAWNKCLLLGGIDPTAATQKVYVLVEVAPPFLLTMEAWVVGCMHVAFVSKLHAIPIL